MNELKTTTELVRQILEQDKQARNSDSLLYLRVLEIVSDDWNISLYSMSVSYFLLNMKELKAPSFETVRRTRQKLQATYPELSACYKVQDGRFEKEAEYRAYAKEVILWVTRNRAILSNFGGLSSGHFGANERGSNE